jgi:hypothetical protein
MKKNIIKYISVLFLWLVCLVMTAHLIIPHDHHLTDSFNTTEDICPVSNGKTDHGSGFPVHCHALNDLTSERATTIFLKKNVKFNNLSFSTLTEAFIFEFQVPLSTIIDIREPFPDPYLFEIPSLRAPPSIS